MFPAVEHCLQKEIILLFVYLSPFPNLFIQSSYFPQKLIFKGSDDVDPAVSTLDPKENERPGKKMKAEKAKDVEEVAIDA